MSDDKKSFYVHPSSIIECNVTIGEGTKIWLFNHVMSGAMIGENCNIGQNVYIGKNVKIGNGVKIQNNVSVYEEVVLEDDVFCGPSCVFTNVINPRSFIERKSEFKKTIVRRGASIGANATILCGIEIGKYAFIAAGAVVTKSVPDYALIVGVPGLRTGWMCKCGVKLNLKIGVGTCGACGADYILHDGMLHENLDK